MFYVAVVAVSVSFALLLLALVLRVAALARMSHLTFTR